MLSCALPRLSQTNLIPVLASDTPSCLCDRISADSTSLLTASDSFRAQVRCTHISLEALAATSEPPRSTYVSDGLNSGGGVRVLVQTNAPDRRRWVEIPILAFAISAIQQAEDNNEAWERSFHNLIMSCDVGGHNGTGNW